MTYMTVSKLMISILMAWIFITEGYDRAYLTRSLGISTPTPQHAKIVIWKASSRLAYVNVDSNYTAINDYKME